MSGPEPHPSDLAGIGRCRQCGERRIVGCGLWLCVSPVAGNDLGDGQRLIGVFRGGEGVVHSRFQAGESFGFDALFVFSDQVPDVLADILIRACLTGPVIPFCKVRHCGHQLEMRAGSTQVFGRIL